jgi:GAF domain
LGASGIVAEKYVVNTSPRLDEESFTRLLAAAYVMQEHQDRVRAKLPATDFAQVISQIVDTQHLVQTRKLGTDAALDLIADRIQKLSPAAGAAIGLLDEFDHDILDYRAVSGTASDMKGRRVQAQASVSAQCLKTGEKLRCPLAEADPRLDEDLRGKVNARSLFVVPVYYEGKVAGTIELFFSEASAFDETDVRATELMAGLVTEVLAQASELKLKRELAAERASVLLALERIKPQLERLNGEQSAFLDKVAGVKGEAGVCHACGHVLAEDEHACGECGELRESEKHRGKELQGKWAAMWERQKELRDSSLAGNREDDVVEPDEPAVYEPGALSESARANGANGYHAHKDELPAWSAAPSDAADQVFWESDESQNAQPLPEAGEAAMPATPPTSLVPSWGMTEEQPESDLVSRVRNWLKAALEESPWKERLQGMWLTRRGDVSLAAAGAVVLIALIWGLWPHRAVTAAVPNDQVTATQGRKRRIKPPAPQLSAFEKVLVGLGLAEPPPAPAYMGDPNVNVWVDLQSALYYCPGAELYGKTEKGKITTQADAQQDQFEPAFRKPCD